MVSFFSDSLWWYGIPFLLAYGYLVSRHRAKQKHNRAVFQDALDSGLVNPPSLHPVVNTQICIGCEACVHACPEYPGHDVLGVIGGKANLISPTDCIGHGACKTACPVGAISLVFGTSDRGVEIPEISPEFETTVPGIFIAGELGGMGLIRNAVEQGRQSMEFLAGRLEKIEGGLDVAVIGAGPAGFAATLAAAELNLKYVTIEQEALGGTVANFPRGKLVMTAPAILPLYGEMKFRETQKEALIDFWHSVEKQTGINIHYQERMENIEPLEPGFLLTTSKNTYRVAAILLAIGRRGTPRRLEVPGDDLPKVVYGVTDPSDYAGKRVCVVGGGDSALEAAHTIADEEGTEVTLSYRSAAFSRAKRKNREKVQQQEVDGKLRVVMESTVTEIAEGHLLLEHDGDSEQLENDAVIVCVGGILPTGFLKEIGIAVDTKFGTA